MYLFISCVLQCVIISHITYYHIWIIPCMFKLEITLNTMVEAFRENNPTCNFFSVLLRWFLYFYCSACLANKKVKNYFKQKISKLENETKTETKLSLRSHWVYYYLILIKMIICSISQCLIYVASLNPLKNLGSGQKQAYYAHLPNKNLRLQGVKWIEPWPSTSNSGDFSTLPHIGS